MIESPRPYTFDRVVRMILSALTLVIIFMLLRYLSDVLVPFAAAVVIAYLLNPLVRAVQRTTKRRGIAVAITVTAVFLGVITLVLVMIPMVMSQFNRFGDTWERLRHDLSATIVSRVNLIAPSTQSAEFTEVDLALTTQPSTDESSLGLTELRAGWEEYTATAEQLPRSQRLNRLRERLSGTVVGSAVEESILYVKSGEFRALVLDVLQKLLAGGATVVNFTINFILGATVIVLVILYVVFLLVDFPSYQRNWRKLLPPAYRDTITGFWDEFEAVMRRYFRGQFIVACISALLFATAFSIIGLPLAIPFGLLVGALNMVPYAQTLAIVPGLLLGVLRALEGDRSLVWSLGFVLLCFGVVQVLQDAIITPRVMGKATGLRPPSILLGIFIWAKLLGLLGLILAIPLTCIGIAYYQRYILRREVEVTPVIQ